MDGDNCENKGKFKRQNHLHLQESRYQKKTKQQQQQQ